MSRPQIMSITAILNPYSPANSQFSTPSTSQPRYSNQLPIQSPLRLNPSLTPCSTPPRSPSAASSSSFSPTSSTSSSPRYSRSPSQTFSIYTGEVDPPTLTKTNVKASRNTTLDRLYVYEDSNAYIEYPETSKRGIGYLFLQDPGNWRSPTSDFAYSLGNPGGQKTADRHGKLLTHDLLGNGTVPCMVRSRTCQGAKVCPHADVDKMKAPHTCASLDLVRERLAQDRNFRLQNDSPSRQIFLKTQAFITSLLRVGCRLTGETAVLDSEDSNEESQFIRDHHQSLRRGYVEKEPRCQGRLSLLHDGGMIACEHYDSQTARSHFHMRLDDSYNREYIKAVLAGDTQAAKELEEDVFLQYNVGPDAECTVVSNHSAQRFNCSYSHRDKNDRLYQPLLERLPCSVKFRVYEPLEDYRVQCPYVLVICSGVHRHPISLPTKTPPRLRNQLFKVFCDIGEDLADLTVRGLLRHGVVHSYLKQLFPQNPLASLYDVHSSLANHEHLAYYIKTARGLYFPHGTGWKGALHLYHLQTERYPVEAHYICRFIEFTDEPGIMDDDGDDEPAPPEGHRIIICMAPGASALLQQAQFLQSNISFKQVQGWKEFIIAGCDRELNSTVVYCRAYVTGESAALHLRLFDAIEELVVEDTGLPIRWRHLYANSNDDEDQNGLMLLWIADQHGGQAKGLGLHMQRIAQRLPNRRDLFQPHRSVAELSWSEHLHRVFRLCSVHVHRNIQECGVPRTVKEAMRSLVCMAHDDWEGAVGIIKEEGGKKGIDWYENKVNSKFALEGICWERSKVPKAVWIAGDRNDNIVEGAHSNINLEGKGCSLVGGMEKARRYDASRLASIKLTQDAGIRRSYASGLPVDNASREIKRKFAGDHKQLEKEDDLIRQHNQKLNKAQERFNKAREKGSKLWAHVQELQQLNSTQEEIQSALEQVQKQKELYVRYRDEVVKQSDKGSALRKGSGREMARTLVLG
ncbi:hypothetical protein PM082_009631 [Marasmius tenuissimus]|nr:hypothetical protein PM082_009631 [Marasmius tenuissimus]